MDNGLYKVRFETSRGAGTGVVALVDGHVRGGDSSMFYYGTFSTVDGVLTVDVVTNVHTIAPHRPSIFGRDIVHLHLEGPFNHDYAQIRGRPREVPETELKVTLARLAD
jgi:hypothetical protein